MNKIRVGIIGCGYWGPNLVRNFSACSATEVVAVCDSSPERLESILRVNRHLNGVQSVDQLLELSLDAVAIATPVSTHFPIAERCLNAGLHVLIEKPLASTVREAQDLVDLAAKRDRVLMVDHTYLFSNAVRKIRELINAGELGDLLYVDSIRINLGLFQRDINVVWDLAPHDLAIVDHVLGREARSISAWGCAHTDRDIEDIAYVNVDYDDRMLANFHVNWLSPVKVRQMIFAGSKKSLIFNELNPTEPLKVYDRGIVLGEGAEDRRKMMVSYRTGDVWSPHVDAGEALQGVVSHFAACIRGETNPISDGQMGVRVVRLLEAASRSIRAQGGRVVLSNGASTNGDRNANRNAHNVAPQGGSSELPQNRPGRPSRAKRGHVLVR